MPQDAFDLYHIVREIKVEEFTRSQRGSELPALGHALAGATASALSNVFTYPLDLLITRLQTQRHLQKVKSSSRDDEYQRIEDAISKIYNDGGLSGFYTGLLEDTAKTVLDAFLFFLVYNFLRQKRLARFAKSHGGRMPSLLPATDELGIGFVAGSLTKLVTSPISNVVTRKQTSSMTSSNQPSGGDTNLAEEAGSGGNTTKASTKIPSTRQILKEIQSEKGFLGLWSGYSASLILTLNPSLTFFLFEAFKRVLLPRSKRDDPHPTATFLIAAISKAIASSVTYPFSLAKTRMQISGTSNHKSSYPPTESEKTKSKSTTAMLTTLLTLATNEGFAALYEGLPLEILKGFLSHGTTMLLKQSIHSTVLRLWFGLSHLLSSLQYTLSGSHSRSKKRLHRLQAEHARKGRDYYDMAIDRAGEIADTTANVANETYEGAKANIGAVTNKLGASAGEMLEQSRETVGGNTLINDVMQMTNETVDMVRDYVGTEDDN